MGLMTGEAINATGVERRPAWIEALLNVALNHHFGCASRAGNLSLYARSHFQVALTDARQRLKGRYDKMDLPGLRSVLARVEL